MKIAFYAPLKSPDHPVPSGDRRMARLLIKALEHAGFEVELASGLRTYEGLGNPEDQARLKREAEEEAARLAGHLKADLWFTYHLYHKAPDWIGPAVSRLLGIPYWLAEASFAPKQLNGPWHEGHLAVEAAVRHADGVLELNPLDRGCISPLLKPGAKCLEIKPFLESGPFRKARVGKSDLRATLAGSYRLDPDALWIAATGMMRPGDKLHSYQLLAKALDQGGIEGWQLLIIGDGPARDQVENQFSGLANIHYLGLREEGEMPEILAACDLFAWPGINEAFGLAMLEAQAAGLPVVSAARPGIANMILDGQTGLLAPEADLKGFTTALQKLLRDSVLRREMSEKALQNTAHHHDIQTAADLLKRELTT